MLRFVTILLFLTTFSAGCKKHGSIAPSVALCFDDNHINEWYANKELFAKYNAHITFCISNIQKLDSSEIRKLKELQQLGHCIANHSLTHKDPQTYIQQFGIDAYLKTEVDSAQKKFQNIGLNPTVFVLPFGLSTPELLDSLEQRYTFTRGAIYNIPYKLSKKKKPLSSYNTIFAYTKTDTYADAMGIDYNYGNTIDKITPALQRCKTDSLCLILYAHIISEENKNYNISSTFIDSLLNEISHTQISYKTLNEL